MIFFIFGVDVINMVACLLAHSV